VGILTRSLLESRLELKLACGEKILSTRGFDGVDREKYPELNEVVCSTEASWGDSSGQTNSSSGRQIRSHDHVRAKIGIR
jgi:hypothetical protein